MTNYWWVTEPNNFYAAAAGGNLWAPLRHVVNGKRWPAVRRLQELRADDIVVHCVRGELHAFSTVTDSPAPAARPFGYSYGHGTDDCVIVRCSYTLVYPWPVSRIPRALREAQPAAGGPFNELGHVNPGYLFRLSEQFGSGLHALLKERIKS
jgi:hypothetical protein